MYVSGNGMSRVAHQQPFDPADLGEVFLRVDAGEGAGGTTLFTTISGPFAPRRVHRSPVTQIALHGHQIVGSIDGRWKRVWGDPKQIPEPPCKTWYRGLAPAFPRDHRDCVIRALSCAVAAADAGLGIDIYLPSPEPAADPGRAARP